MKRMTITLIAPRQRQLFFFFTLKKRRIRRRFQKFASKPG
jgi:hypothetical protein